MKHCFRIAICMFLLLGFLQAGLVLDGLLNDFGLRLLRDDVSCSENVTFASPVMNSMGDCLNNSFTIMEVGLKQAQKECTVTNDRLEDSLITWVLIKNLYPMETSSNCTSQEARNWMQFLTDCDSLFQRLRSNQ